MTIGLSVTSAHADGYKFKVHNTTDQKIVKLLVSEDGETWGTFDVGKGIAAAETATMEWNESTDNEGCEQKVKAVFSDKSESEEASFDFCEKNLELEF